MQAEQEQLGIPVSASGARRLLAVAQRHSSITVPSPMLLVCPLSCASCGLFHAGRQQHADPCSTWKFPPLHGLSDEKRNHDRRPTAQVRSIGLSAHSLLRFSHISRIQSINLLRVSLFSPCVYHCYISPPAARSSFAGRSRLHKLCSREQSLAIQMFGTAESR